MHKCFMVKIGGAKNVNWTKIGEIYTFCGTREEIGHFLEIGKYAKCIIDLGGMDALPTHSQT